MALRERRTRADSRAGACDAPGREGATHPVYGEQVTRVLRARSTGRLGRVGWLLGGGETRWALTDRRLVHETRAGGEVRVRSVRFVDIRSIEDGSRVPAPSLVLGTLLSLGGVLGEGGVGRRALAFLGGLALVGRADLRRRRVLTVRSVDGEAFSLAAPAGARTDEFLWHLRAERHKHA